jgi:hypothetical protein
MVVGTYNDASENSPSTAKSDPRESDGELQGDGSLADLITSTKKALFESRPAAEDNQTVTTNCSRKWVPINKTSGNKTEEVTTLGTGCKGTSFAEGTNFVAKDAPTKKTPAKDMNTKINDCVVKIKLKILHGVNDVQETVIGMMDHCLTILHECNKRACFLNKKKSHEANKAADFPRDFTDFYDNWGKWDESVRAFLNTIPADKSRSFTGSFYFRCERDPAQLFEKTLLKMASQKKHKGTMAIELKPCQHLDTMRDIIFFNLPFSSDEFLRSTLHKRKAEQKSTLIKRHPSKYPRMEWGPPLPDFVMVRDFVRNTP